MEKDRVRSVSTGTGSGWSTGTGSRGSTGTGSRGSTGTDGLLSRIGLNDNKAGMEGLDRDKINKIILDASKGSRFYENELKREQQVNQRVERMMRQKDSITHAQLENAHTEVEKLRSSLERGRDLSRVMVHVDMDAFYAAVEMRDRPELRDQPMAVGSTSMLSTSNYHARKFGVRAAMPGFIARKLCPALVIVPTNFDKYRAVSSEIREIFADYDPHFQPLSLDEAYLDLTEHLEQRACWPEALRTHRYHQAQGEVQSQPSQETGADLSPLLFDDSPTGSSSDGSGPGLFQAFADDDSTASSSGGSGPGFRVFGTCAEEAVREMRFRIEQKTSLTASAGIASNMLLAKVCSDLNKPNGQYRLAADRATVLEFMEKLPVRKVPGVGKVSEKLLGALGISSCAHLGQQMALLSLLFSQTAWHHFLSISLGLGATRLERDGERKSMSTERTFREMNRAEDQVSLCRELCEDLSNDLKREGLKGKTVTLKLKNVQFEVRTRAWTLPCAVGTAPEIFSVANQLLRTEMDSVKPLPLRLRLMGVRISSFASSEDKAPQQRSIVGFLQNGRTDPAPPPSSPPPPPHVSSQMCGKDTSVQSLPPPSSCAPQLHSTQSPLSWSPQLPSAQQQYPGQPLGPAEPLGPAAEQHHSCSGPDAGQKAGSGPEVGHRAGTGPEVGHRAGTGPTEQRSFFQRAYAQRLRLQAEEHDGDMKETDSSTSSEVRDYWSHSSRSTAAEEPSSPSGCGDTPRPVGGGLTCPVCLGEVDTSDLGVFNAHIDLCLSGDRSRWSPERSEDASASPRSHTNHAGFNRLGAPVGGDSGAAVVMMSSEAESQPLGPAPLTCPVCHVTQAGSRDLSAFNRHLDLCLNQEVVRSLTSDPCLNQVKGQRALTSGSAGPTRGAKVKERVEPQPGTSNKHKGKRRHSPRSSPAKKNPSHHLNTIDRFFR